MCKIKLFASFICLLIMQSSCHKSFYDPISGPPTNLADLDDIDTSGLKNKMIRIDSLQKNTQNKIPDSLKVKMGIRSRF